MAFQEKTKSEKEDPKPSSVAQRRNKVRLGVVGLAALTLGTTTFWAFNASHKKDPQLGEPHISTKSKLPSMELAGQSVVMILQPERKTNSREIAYVVDSLRRTVQTGGLKKQQSLELTAQASTLEHERNQSPQSIEFKLTFSSQNNQFHISPTSSASIPVIQKAQGDIIIIGGELPSITAAMTAAKKGASVILVYSGALGGLISDTGGNLRFYDGGVNFDNTPNEKELFKVLGVHNNISIPKGVSEKIEAYLKEKYKGITLLKTKSCAEIEVRKDKKNIASITTPEGTEITGNLFIDTTDGIIPEKMGFPIDIRSPQLADGLVFDIDKISREEIAVIGKSDCISPEQICRSFGITLESALKHKSIKEAYNKMLTAQPNPYSQIRDEMGIGFGKFAEGFHFYMLCKGLVSHDPTLDTVNSLRVMTKFNVAFTDGGANFNSISYRLPYLKFQGCAPAAGDPDLLPFITVDKQGMTEYMQLVLKRSDITIRTPEEFYFRKATAMLQPQVFAKPLSIKDIKWNYGIRITKDMMSYQIDLRGAFQRDPFDSIPNANNLIKDGPLMPGKQKIKDRIFWHIDSRVAEVRDSNLYVVSKILPPKGLFGATRIVTGESRLADAVVEDIYKRHRLGE